MADQAHEAEEWEDRQTHVSIGPKCDYALPASEAAAAACGRIESPARAVATKSVI